MKVLALDYGMKRIGLALGDTETKLALPHGTLQRSSDEVLLGQLQQVVDEEDVGTVVVGEPVALSGKASHETGAARRFAELLRANLSVPVELVDERLTSRRADVALAESAAKTRDELAAMFMLQDYLERSAGPGALPEL